MDHLKPATHSRDHRDEHTDPLNGPTFPLVDEGGDPPNPGDVLDEDYAELINGFAQPAAPLEQWGYRRSLRPLQFVGALDANSAASGAIATYVPTELIPAVDLSLRTSVIVADVHLPAVALVSSVDGSVVVSWGSSSGIAFATMQGSYVDLDPPSGADYTQMADFSGATFKTNSALFAKTEYTGTGGDYWGIEIPGEKLVCVTVWADSPGDTPNGKHMIDWRLGGDYGGVVAYGPQGGVFNGFTDDWTSINALRMTDGIWRHDYMARTTTPNSFILGVNHNVTGVTGGPYQFRYGISVWLLGDPPV